MSNASILAELKPCGYVLATSQYKYFALKCLYCDKKYGHWAIFLQHLRELHMDIVEDTQGLIESAQEILEPDIQNNGMSSEECRTNYIHADEEDNENDVSSTIYELDASCNKTVGNILVENKVGEDVYERNPEDILVKDSDTESCTKQSISKDDLKDSLDYFNETKYAVLPECGKQKLKIDLTEKNFGTQQFIELYEHFPTLWPTEGIRNNVDKIQCLAKTELLRKLSEFNMFISTADLEVHILQLHQQYSNIASRLEEGIEISDIEEKYFTACSYLQPYNKPEFEQYLIMYETESKDSFGDQSLNNESSDDVNDIESSQSGLDSNDAVIDNVQERHRAPSLVKFSTRNKITCDFIQCFRDQLCLWNPQDPAYKDIKVRVQAINNIKEFFSNNYSLKLTEGKISAEIKRLYSFYKRCISSRRNLNDIRKYYYECCDFLADANLDIMPLISSSAYQKISFSLNDEFTLGFIDFFAMHPVLWDKNHHNYSILNIRKEAYDEICMNLRQIYNVDFTNDELYRALSRLKKHYYSLQHKKIIDVSLTKEDQNFLDRCSFLPTSNTILQCHICERLLRSQSTLQTHLLKAHNIGELPYKCDYCEQRFAQRYLKKEHEVRAHTKQFEWFCPYCAKGFANRRAMEMHQMVHTGERNVICEFCGKGFRLKYEMTEHVKIMHERLRRFKCSLCPKDFLRKRELDDHMRTHLNIRNKICNICGKGFTNVHGLFRHKQLHSDVKRYECQICGERFRLISGLSAHKKRKHQIVKQTENSTNVLVEEEAEVNGSRNCVRHGEWSDAK